MQPTRKIRTFLFKKTSKILLSVAAVATVAIGTSDSQAAVIDNFNSGGGSASAAAGGNDTDSSAALTTDTIGGFRTILVPGGTSVSGLGNLTVSANPMSSGLLSFSLDAMTSGSAVITWDANGAGLGGADLTDAGASTFFTFDILAIDQGDVDLLLSVEDTNGNIATQTFINAGVGTQQTAFTAFSNFPPTDFSSVKSVSLEIRGINASDLVLDRLFTFGQIAVPEPSSLALCFSAFGVLALIRRRRNQAQMA